MFDLVDSALSSRVRLTYDQRDSALASWLIKMICDNLVMCGEKISDTEHISAILNGLTPDYESVTALPASNLMM
ncbi:hypothetical protein J1N35_024550 [Gossypium stocksii]|uniref:Uncharacterized protein n=1 Tax=Gossypium stocksii TaxID=47602 RepID=A0A9D3V4J8_9ROSI|nr:hypothetical protein J1N35_024550 [Gossypium stocksii]